MEAAKLPSFKQMKSRNVHHIGILRNVANGFKASGGPDTLMTLYRWGCLDHGQLTERGREFLAWLDEEKGN